MLTNFLGVFNDNLLKNLICFISIGWIASEYRSLVLSAAAGLMVLPYIFFSPRSGYYAKKYNKVWIMQITKLAEIPIVTIGAIGFIYQNLACVLSAMFLMGLQSCIHSPAKYGLIRDIGKEEGISFGTGTLEMLTFMAVLLGTVIASVISDVNTSEYISKEIILTSVMLIIALTGWIVSKYIKAQEPEPESNISRPQNPIKFFYKSLKNSKDNYPGLNYVVMGLSSFWLIGSLIQLNIILHAKESLLINNTQTGTIMAFVAISIGVGSGLAGIISKKDKKMKLVSIGAAGLIISNTLIYILSPSPVLFSVLVSFAGFSGGLFKIPLNTWIQKNVKGRSLGDAIAYNNLSVFVYILASAIIFSPLTQIGGTKMVFLFIAIISLIVFILLGKTLLWKKTEKV